MKLKQILMTAALGLLALQAAAQDMSQLMQPLPVDPKVRVGHLDNGLTYYIRHNEEPKNQAFFYIAQKVGSIQEEESQRGLAHFLEHMCFNGTTHFPDSSLIEYLEGIGVKFGAQLNAYTSVEETVYNIDNVPAREGAIDSCLLILHDWSHDLTLDGKEIDKERGVIHGEWRMRNTGFTRILVKHLEELMSNSRYGRRFPIGLMEVVDECPYDTLRAYYHKWYRPDLQGIIVVGDIDVDQVEGKIKNLFGPITVKQPVAQRVNYSVPDNTEAVVVSDSDPEVTSQVVMISMKHPAIPDSVRNTLPTYLAENIISTATSVLNQRLRELSLKADCPFHGASVSDGEFLLSSKVTGAFNIEIVPKEGRVEEAVKAVMEEVYRVDEFGFTKGEIDRAVLNRLSSMEQLFNNRDKQKSINYAHEYYRSFLNNEPIPGIEMEYQLMQQVFPQVPAEAFSQTIQQYISRTDTNLVVLSLNPEKEGLAIPTKDQLLGAIHAAQQSQLTAWVDNVKTGPLIENLPKPGKVKKEAAGPCDSKVLTLSNGVKVIMKQTDFKDDEIRMMAWSDGGVGRYPVSERINLEAFDGVMSHSKIGGFSSTELTKALAGKNVRSSAGVGLREESFSGFSSKKDIQTLFELIYMTFQPREKDEEAVASYLAGLKETLRNKDLDPMSSLSDSIQATLYGHNPRLQPMTEAEVDQVNYDRILEMWADRFADASDFTFMFLGNIDEVQIRELAAQYLATLPKVKRKDKPVDPGLNFVTGDVTNRYQKKMQTPQSFIVSAWTGDTEMTVRNTALMTILGNCVAEQYLKKIREELGAAYSTSAQGMITRGSDDRPRYVLQAAFPLKPEMTDTCLQIVQDVFEDVAENGVSEESVSKAKEYLLKTFKQNQRENGFWMSRIASIVRRGYDPAENYEQVVSAITPSNVKQMATTILTEGNRVRVVMEPEAAQE
ncbi:MAG: insulinase family protein [Bacteroidaceae bacterium]|nr:insulinase family protein [Bacteroidaceae bacterium]